MLIIFDWDGTLLDSEGKIVSCMQKAAAELGLPPCSVGEIRNIIGLELGLAIRRLHPELSLAAAFAMREAYSKAFIAADVTPCPFFPNVEASLHELKRAGHTLCVATGKSRRGLDRVFGHLPVSRLFSATRCADETASKPDPQMLLELCEVFSEAPEDALMIGDTEYDLEMASRINMPRIGVAYGAHQINRLRRWQPRAVIDCMSELPPIVEQIAQRNPGHYDLWPLRPC